MADRCPQCGVLVMDLQAVACPECGAALAEDTGITAKPSSPGLARDRLADVPNIEDPSAAGPSCPAAVLVILSTFLCAGQGILMHFGEPGRVGLGRETMIGAIIGFVIGMVLAVDHWFFERKLKALIAAPDGDVDAGDFPRSLRRPSEGVAIAMLILPITMGIVQWNSQTLGFTEMQMAVMGAAVIVATSVLGYVSIRQMALSRDRLAPEHGGLRNPAIVYLCMLGFWIIFYPIHFVSRRRMGGRNLIVPGLIATAVYCLPILQPFLTTPELPDVGDAEVMSLVKSLIEEDPTMRPATLKEPAEVAFDKPFQERFGRCVAVTKHGEEPITYTINWQNRDADIWQVQLTGLLPRFDDPHVLDLVRDIVMEDMMKRGQPIRVKLNGDILRNAELVAYDPVLQRRTGKVLRPSPMGETPIFYVIEWQGADRKNFNVTTHDRLP